MWLKLQRKVNTVIHDLTTAQDKQKTKTRLLHGHHGKVASRITENGTDRFDRFMSSRTFIPTSFTHTLKSPDAFQSLSPLFHRQILFVTTKVGDTQLFTFHHLSRRFELPGPSDPDLAYVGQT